MDKREKKNKRVGLITSIGIHAVLLILFIFLIAWREQYPPPQPIGMSINFGNVEAGSGDTQPESRQEEEVTEEIQEETEPIEEEIQEEQVPEVVDEVVEPKPEPTENTEEAATEALQKEGPLKAEEPAEETKPAPEKEVKEKPVEPVEQKEEPVEEKEEERDLQAVYKGPQSDETNDAQSQGNTEEQGDQGNEEGDLDSRSLYGGPGDGGGGFSHNLTGWGTNFQLPEEKPEATGKLEFKIQVDASGNVIRIFTTKRIGDSEAEKFYRDLIEKQMKFYRTSGSGDIPSLSEGTVTLNLKVK